MNFITRQQETDFRNLVLVLAAIAVLMLSSCSSQPKHKRLAAPKPISAEAVWLDDSL